MSLLLLLGGCGPAATTPVSPTTTATTTTTADNQTATTPPPPSSSGGFEPDRSGWAHTEQVFLRGTRSERTEGRLAYNGHPIGGALGELITPIGRYVYRTGRWGAVQWTVWPSAFTPGVDGADTTAATCTGAAFTPADATTGWYDSTWPAVRPGTPGDWCYAVKLGVWFEPTRATDLAALHGLKDPPDPFSDLAPETPPAPGSSFIGNVPGSWKAWIDRMPPGPARLFVTGKVKVRQAGCTATLEFSELMKSSPPILVLRLVVKEPAGPSAQVITELDVRYETTQNTEAGAIKLVFPDGTSQDIGDIDEAR
ncbi:MAG: hypothetical protein AB7K09_02200 [Planctomycetota bacterium]